MRTRNIIRWHKKRRENSAKAEAPQSADALSLSALAGLSADNDRAEERQVPKVASAA